MRLELNKNTHIYILLFGMLLIFFAQPFKATSIASLGTTLIIGATLLAAYHGFIARGIKKTNDALQKKDSILIFLILTATIAFIYGGGYSYSRIVPLVCFLECPILLFSTKQSDKKMRLIIYSIFYIFSFYCIYLFLSPKAYLYTGKYGISEIDSLTLGLPNPNQTAMCLLTVFFVLCIAATEASKCITKILLAFNTLAMLYLIYLTKSRTALVIAGGFTIFFWPAVRKRFSRIIIKSSLVFPVVFVGVLIALKDSLAGILFMDDALDTGRLEIFTNALNSLTVSNVFLGNYASYASHNLHNIFISVFVEYGLLTAVMFLLFMRECLVNVMYRFSINNKRCIAASVGFAMLMIFSSTEAAFYIGGSIYAGFVFVIYYLCLPTDI